MLLRMKDYSHVKISCFPGQQPLVFSIFFFNLKKNRKFIHLPYFRRLRTLVLSMKKPFASDAFLFLPLIFSDSSSYDDTCFVFVESSRVVYCTSNTRLSELPFDVVEEYMSKWKEEGWEGYKMAQRLGVYFVLSTTFDSKEA